MLRSAGTRLFITLDDFLMMIANATFSKTVLFGKSLKSWNTTPSSRR